MIAVILILLVVLNYCKEILYLGNMVHKIIRFILISYFILKDIILMIGVMNNNVGINIYTIIHIHLTGKYEIAYFILM